MRSHEKVPPNILCTHPFSLGGTRPKAFPWRARVLCESGPGAGQRAVQGLVDAKRLAHIMFVSVLGTPIYTLEDFTYKSEVLAFYNIERSGTTEPHSHAEATAESELVPPLSRHFGC